MFRALRITSIPFAAFVSLTGYAAEPPSATGAEIFGQYCASCHGEHLQGGAAQSLVDGKWQYGAKRSTQARNIRLGIPEAGMPPWASTLSDGEINAVLDYILNTAEHAGAKPPELPATLASEDYTLAVEVMATPGLDRPWSIAFIDTGLALVTEQGGGLHWLRDGKLSPRITATPVVRDKGQGGLLDVSFSPHFATDGWVYLSYSHAADRAGAEVGMTRIVRGHIIDLTWRDEQVVWEAPLEQYRPTSHHYGSRLAWDEAGDLFFSIGERGFADDAQDPQRVNGKIHRIHADGTIPKDNPWADRQEGFPSVYSYGHRNPQGLAFEPGTGVLWETEHGPMGGDELNQPKIGRNYGWPVITWGINYDGKPVSEFTTKPGMEQPLTYWVPSIAPCGIDFYVGDEIPPLAGQHSRIRTPLSRDTPGCSARRPGNPPGNLVQKLWPRAGRRDCPRRQHIRIAEYTGQDRAPHPGSLEISPFSASHCAKNSRATPW